MLLLIDVTINNFVNFVFILFTRCLIFRSSRVIGGMVN